MFLNESVPFQHSQALNKGNSLHNGTFMSFFLSFGKGKGFFIVIY